nr:T7-like tail fiber [uncultured Mediterranean phage uvMED]
MANVIRLKRASGSDPAASDLVSGEPAVRTDTGELFFKKDDGSVAKVSGAGGGPDFKYLALRNAANNGAASYPNADFTLVTSGTTTALTPTAANTLLVSVNGVIQKPNTGTSTPSSGFALSGSTIKFGGNISAAPDFILYQESGGIGEPSDETVSEDKLKVSNSPVNGYFLSAQSGNTGGLTWAAPVATSCTGNSATATALATARAINGVNFDGTAAITVTAAAGTLSGNTLNSSVVTSSLTSLGDLAGLTVTGDLVVDTSTLKVDSSNNRVGIGTTSPAMPLHIKSDTPYIRFEDDNDNQDWQIEARAFFSIYDVNDSAHRLLIDGSGNVGIGTTSPSSHLEIVGETGVNLFLNAATHDASTANQARIQLGYVHSGGQALGHLKLDETGGNSFDGILKLGVPYNNGSGGSSTREVIEADFNGNICFPGSTVVFDTTARTNGLQLYYETDSGIATLGSYSSGGSTVLNFHTNSGGGASAERMRIDSSGHILPGTDSQYNIGSNSVRFANIYADTLYGDGSNLTGVSAGATGGGSDEVFYENGQTVTTSYSITSNKNAMSAGPLSINSGAVVTVPSGSVWTIV